MCDDKLEKCQLDCVYTNGDITSTQINRCYTKCSKKYENCEDSVSTKNCYDCVFNCAESFDTNLRLCLSNVNIEISRNSYDACTIAETTIFDLCKAECETSWA
jgi:hypothetical protein